MNSFNEIKKVRISVIGLGYVGLPLALAFAREVPNVMGFDVNGSKIEELRKGFDRTGEADPVALKSSSLIFTSDPADLQNTDVFIIAVPTPIDRAHRPDLSFLLQASELVGKVMKPGTVVCLNRRSTLA
jgi:UDP-N-acetyl-D-galactosamine dehydrogenase